jgi:peptidoglycan/LPS O-acetylase OafA/YrhL
MTEGIGNPFPEVGKLGWMGVDLFFVLSGYLIGSQLLKEYAAGQTPAIGTFYLRRAFRILPTYWLVLAFYVFVPTFREAQGLQPAWQFFTFSENFLIDYQHNRAFSHAWSLCVEEHFYLFFPLLVWVLMKRPSWKITATVCAVIFAGGMLLRGYVWLHYVGVPGHSPFAYVEWIYYPTIMRLDGLLAGVVLASIRWFKPSVWQKAMNNPYALLGVGLASTAAAIWVAKGRVDFGASVFGFPLLSVSLALIVAACISKRCLLGRIRIPGAEAIATVTFSLYLSHKMTWHTIRTCWPELVNGSGAQSFCIYAGSAFLVGSLLYFAIERPFLLLRQSAWLASLVSSSHPAQESGEKACLKG